MIQAYVTVQSNDPTNRRPQRQYVGPSIGLLFIGAAPILELALILVEPFPCHYVYPYDWSRETRRIATEREYPEILA